jgi:hypothetical protein
MSRRPTVDVEVLKQRVEDAKQSLEHQLSALVASDSWRSTLESMAVLGKTSIARLSFRNFLLLLSQREDVAHAATFQAWRSMGRIVKRGEKALYVLKPRFARKGEGDADDKRLIGFGVLPLFALDQTEGPALATPAEPPDFDTSEAFEHTVEQLRTLALAKCPHVISIELRPRAPIDNPDWAGWFHRPTRSIVVLTDVSPQQQFAVLVHELAHAILHGEVNHHEKPRKEVEAESTAFVVCHALGLDTSRFSLPYVASWANGDVAEVAAAGENVRRASLTILDALVGDGTHTDEADAALDGGAQHAA